MSKKTHKWLIWFNYAVLGAGAFAIAATALPIMAQSAKSPSTERPSTAHMANVSGSLLDLHEEYQAYLQQNNVQRSSAVFNSSSSRLIITAETVVIDAAASGDPNALAEDLEALGAQDVAVFGRMVSCRLPPAAVGNSGSQ